MLQITRPAACNFKVEIFVDRWNYDLNWEDITSCMGFLSDGQRFCIGYRTLAFLHITFTVTNCHDINQMLSMELFTGNYRYYPFPEIYNKS